MRSCPAGIKLGLTDDCQKLVVTEVRLEHIIMQLVRYSFVTIVIYAFDYYYYVHEGNFCSFTEAKGAWTRTEKGSIFTFNNESEQKAAATASELYNRKSGHVEGYF